MLKASKSEKRPLGEPPKPPKPGFDGFGGTPEARFQKNEGGFDGFGGTPEAHIVKKAPGALNPLDLLQNLFERDLDVRLDTDGRLLVTPGNKLSDLDRTNIRAHLPTLKRLVSCDYTHHPEGWSAEPDMPNRVVLVRQGRLLDSCIFRTTTGALELIRRLAVGEPLTLAFHAACAFEDASQTNHDRETTESQTLTTPYRKTAS